MWTTTAARPTVVTKTLCRDGQHCTIRRPCLCVLPRDQTYKQTPKKLNKGPIFPDRGRDRLFQRPIVGGRNNRISNMRFNVNPVNHIGLCSKQTPLSFTMTWSDCGWHENRDTSVSSAPCTMSSAMSILLRSSRGWLLFLSRTRR